MPRHKKHSRTTKKPTSIVEKPQEHFSVSISFFSSTSTKINSDGTQTTVTQEHGSSTGIFSEMDPKEFFKSSPKIGF